MRVNKWVSFCKVDFIFVLSTFRAVIFGNVRFLSFDFFEFTSGDIWRVDYLGQIVRWHQFCNVLWVKTFCDNLWVDILQSLFSELKFCHILWVDILWVDILCELTFSYLFSELTIHGCSIKEENHNLAEGPY